MKLLGALGPFLTGVGIALAAAGLLGVLTVGAVLFLPRGLLLQAVGREVKPEPHVEWVAQDVPPATALPAVPPTPDFSLDSAARRLYFLWIPKLGLYAPVTPVSTQEVVSDGETLRQLDVPNAFAAGWSDQSAPVGAPGNTVLVGHNNEYGNVFKDLWYLAAGDEIIMQTEAGERYYAVSEVAYFEEKGLPLEKRLANSHWIAPSPDERLTLVTCWPYYTNTHRLVVVARPAQ